MLTLSQIVENTSTQEDVQASVLTSWTDPDEKVLSDKEDHVMTHEYQSTDSVKMLSNEISVTSNEDTSNYHGKCNDLLQDSTTSVGNQDTNSNSNLTASGDSAGQTSLVWDK